MTWKKKDDDEKEETDHQNALWNLELAAEWPEERTLKYSVPGDMLGPLTVRTSGLEEGRSEGHHWVCFISLLIQSFHSLPAGFSIALGSLIFKSFTVISVHSLRDHLHDLIFLTIWKWKDFSRHLTRIFLLYLFFSSLSCKHNHLKGLWLGILIFLSLRDHCDDSANLELRRLSLRVF